MFSMPSEARIVEVGPRDGLQNETQRVPTEVKVEFVDRLSRAGLAQIEVSSFVRPMWIPQLADAGEVFGRIARRPGTEYSALVPNLKGLERAVAAGVRSIAVLVSSSEAHNRQNLNRGIEESLADVAAVTAAARERGIRVRCYVSMVFGCPYEGEVPLARILGIAERLVALGVEEISLGDTVGFATPRQVWERVGAVAGICPVERLALHFHDTRGTALANVLAGLDVGVRTFDGSVGGLGGCPYAPGASGNLATEDLVQMLHGMGIRTGIDLPALVDASAFIERQLRKTLPGRYLRAVTGPCSSPEPASGR